MKKLLLCLAAFTLLCAFALAEAPFETINVTFEDGFSVMLPADWVSYAVPEELRSSGILYCLGSPDGSRLMYIQMRETDLESSDALELAMAAEKGVTLTGASSDNGFMLYSFRRVDASGCVALHEGNLINLMFSPKSDSDNMMIAAMVMESFEWNAPEESGEAAGAPQDASDVIEDVQDIPVETAAAEEDAPETAEGPAEQPGEAADDSVG